MSEAHRLLSVLGALLLAAPSVIARADDGALEPALGHLVAASPGRARIDAAQEIIALGPQALGDLQAKLKQQRTTTTAELRPVLARFHADVPDDKGTFRQPPRPPKGGPPPEPDWLAELAAMPDEPAVRDALEVVALLRALAATRQVAAADAMLDFTFSSEGIVFRDEVGRCIRSMSPYSLASLLRASQDKKRAGGSYGRYAGYQLDRLEKGRPEDAFAAAPDDAMEVAMLKAVAAVKHPDAVYVVMARTNDPSHAVRQAAREAWMAYVTGPPPPPAPKAKRKLPGGKMSDRPLPLYLTYRELATEEALRVLTELRGGNAPPEGETVEQMTSEIFALYDDKRAHRWDERMTKAAQATGQGRWADATAIYDAILSEDPLFAGRTAMAAAYRERGREEATAGKWETAASNLSRALSLDPAGTEARKVEGELHYARARLHHDDDELTLALAADPESPQARDLLKKHVRARYAWRLAVGLGAGGLGLVLLAAGLLLRRRRPAAA